MQIKLSYVNHGWPIHKESSKTGEKCSAVNPSPQTTCQPVWRFLLAISIAAMARPMHIHEDPVHCKRQATQDSAFCGPPQQSFRMSILKALLKANEAQKIMQPWMLFKHNPGPLPSACNSHLGEVQHVTRTHGLMSTPSAPIGKSTSLCWYGCTDRDGGVMSLLQEPGDQALVAVPCSLVQGGLLGRGRYRGCLLLLLPCALCGFLRHLRVLRLSLLQ